MNGAEGSNVQKEQSAKGKLNGKGESKMLLEWKAKKKKRMRG